MGAKETPEGGVQREDTDYFDKEEIRRYGSNMYSDEQNMYVRIATK